MKEKGKKRLRTLAVILVAVLLAYTVIAVSPRPTNYAGDNPMMKDGETPILIAHGGGNKEFPDNTLEAFYNAYSVDSRVMMETDVSITKDGVVILSHDTTIDRKTNETGAIADWNYSDLISKRVDFGYTNPTEDQRLAGERVKFKNEKGVEIRPTDVPNYESCAWLENRDPEVFLATTLEELLVAFPENRINVEIKQEGELGLRATAAVIELLRKYNSFDRVVLASFHNEIYNKFKEYKRSGEVPECFMFSPGIAGVAGFFLLESVRLDALFFDKICVLQLPTEEYGLNFATAHLVRQAHKHNLAVHYWTVNDKDEMRMLIEIGADGIMTDYPHRLAEVYAEYGK